jgi:hypothetical protein
VSEHVDCGLCGAEGHEGRELFWARLVEWTEAEQLRAGKPRYEAIARCRDFQACRRRVEERGQAWPIVDAVTNSTINLGRPTEELPV